MILGIDEVGRGPWAGPLVVGAVVLPAAAQAGVASGQWMSGLTDSKKLTAKKRSELDALIRDQALGWGLGWVHADELDKVGLAAALRLATIRAVEAIAVPYHEIIIDGTINFLAATTKGQYVTTLPKADALIPAVSAASIIAKVARDTYMAKQAERYPGYGFEKHVGYGTAAHRNALEEQGITPLHRTSFKPIALLMAQREHRGQPVSGAEKGTTKVVGAAFEQQVADHLAAQGYTVVARNWKTRYCEIDVIAKKEQTLYFVEAKYRSSQNQGDGLAAITPQKKRQMERAANLYIAKIAYKGESKLVVAYQEYTNKGSQERRIALLHLTE